MKLLLTSFLFFLLVRVEIQGSALFERTVPCEKVEHSQCFFNTTTRITSNSIGVDSGDMANRVYFNTNTKILYLPIGLSKVFPNLVEIDATYCALHAVTSDNLSGLKHLSRLWLRDNMIETIPKGTFEGLVGLSDVDLREYA